MSLDANVRVSHRCRGNDLLCDHPQSVHHGDVAQPPSYPQRCVAILKERKTRKVSHVGSVYTVDGVPVCVCSRTTVMALGLAPFCRSTLMTCVFPCWAAW